MTARRWDAESVGERVGDALSLIEESRIIEGRTTKTRDWRVGVTDDGHVTVQVTMADGDVLVVLDRAEPMRVQ